VSVRTSPKYAFPLAGDVSARAVVVCATAVPLPVRTACAEDAFTALLLRVSVSVRAPEAVAWNIASSSQSAPLATLPPLAHGLETEEPRLKSPVLPLA